MRNLQLTPTEVAVLLAEVEIEAEVQWPSLIAVDSPDDYLLMF